MTRRWLGEDARARFADARIDAIRRLGSIARDAACEFVVVCGDVFESNHVERRTVVRALEALHGIPVPVVLLPGNHDPLDAASVFRKEPFRSEAPSHVHVLADMEPLRLSSGVEVVGAPWTSKRPGRDLVAELCAGLRPTQGGVVRVALAHGAVDSLSPNRDDPARIDLAAAERALADGRIHYLALGDRHSRTRVGDSGRIHYAGAPEPTDFDEIDPGHALVVELDAERAIVTPHDTATWRFVRRARIPIDGPRDLAALEQWLDTQPDKARTVLRLGFEGTVDLAGAARLELALLRAQDLFAAVTRAEGQLAVLPEHADFDALGLSGFAADAVETLRDEAAGHGVDAVIARDALALLVRLASPSADGGAA